MSEPESGSSAAWDQFLIGKRSMLADYDRARSHSRNLPVQTSHGDVAEATFRAWLESFLPKRFGVTAGYIRGQRLRTRFDYAHFDVIIYDQLHAPILWIDENKDRSNAGRARIIPAEYVAAVLEVKSTFTSESVEAAAKKLRQLDPLMAGTDDPSDRYPTYLPTHSVLGIVFFELLREHARSVKTLETLRDLAELRRAFYCAIILRGEGLNEDHTGMVQMLAGDKPIAAMERPQGLLGNVTLAQSVEREGRHLSSMLMWSPIHFSDFAFNLLAIMNGTYRPGSVSSWHGLDMSKFPEPGSGSDGAAPSPKGQ